MDTNCFYEIQSLYQRHKKYFKNISFVGLEGKDIVFRFIIEYSSLMDFDP